MIVLLVYGESAEPVTLILHGSDGTTWLSITEDSQTHSDAKLIAMIRKTLKSSALTGYKQGG